MALSFWGYCRILREGFISMVLQVVGLFLFFWSVFAFCFLFSFIQGLFLSPVSCLLHISYAFVCLLVVWYISCISVSLFSLFVFSDLIS
jgi:hypothetical protein